MDRDQGYTQRKTGQEEEHICSKLTKKSAQEEHPGNPASYQQYMTGNGALSQAQSQSSFQGQNDM